MRRILLFLSIVILFTGCANLADLRDGEDSPYERGTYGGIGAEYGFLDDRSPASVGDAPESNQSWVDEDSRDREVRRNAYRNPSYAENPNVPPSVKRQFSQHPRATKKDFLDDGNEGSLWAPTGQTNYYFTENQIRSMGDILKLKFEENLLRDLALEARNTLSDEEVEMELEKITKDREMAAQQPKAGAGRRTTATKQPEAPEPKEPTFEDINLKDRLGVKEGDTMLIEVLQRYPNGNYKVRGTKRVMVAGQPKIMSLLAVARSDDVEGKEEFGSGGLYEYRIKLFR